jgi:hypothetical protein
MVRHEREGVKVDGKQSQRAAENSKDDSIQGLARSKQKSLANCLRRYFDDESGRNKTR